MKLKKKLEDLQGRVAHDSDAGDQSAGSHSTPRVPCQSCSGSRYTPPDVECYFTAPMYTEARSVSPTLCLSSDSTAPTSDFAASTPLEPLFTSYVTPTHSTHPSTLLDPSHPLTNRYTVDEEISPFSAGYAEMAGNGSSVMGYLNATAQLPR